MIFGEKIKEKEGEKNQILCFFFCLEKEKYFQFFGVCLLFEIFFI